MIWIIHSKHRNTISTTHTKNSKTNANKKKLQTCKSISEAFLKPPAGTSCIPRVAATLMSYATRPDSSYAVAASQSTKAS